MTEEDWPDCTTPNCVGEINPRRWKLGYRTCMKCGSPLKQFTVAPVCNKGAYQVIAVEDIKTAGRKV